MTLRTRSEAEQIAFFDDLEGRFQRAVERTGAVDVDLDLAGRVVRLSFAGTALEPTVIRALAHRRIPPVETPDATLHLWDSKSTGVPVPPPPCEREAFSDRGDLWGFHSDRIRTAFHWLDYSINLFDHQRALGVWWVQSAAVLPYWTLASPLRTMFHWALERHRRQLLHAAAIGNGERALLLVGRGGVGKSSTALACLEAGLEFLGDDYVIVRDGPTPTVHPLYATAKVFPADLERFPSAARERHVAGQTPEDKAVVFLDPDFLDRIPGERPLAAIAVPTAVDCDTTRFLPVEHAVVQQAATFTTMSQLPYAGNETHAFISDLCHRLPGHRIELGRDRRELAAAVRQLLGTDAYRARPAPRPRAAAPLISVVIPVLDGERFLEEAVRCVLAQRWPSLEIIVVDDGSTDRTPEIARALPCEVHYFRQENLGPAAARNRGIRDAAGDYVAFLDVDDLWPDNTLSTFMEELRADPALDLVQGYAQVTEWNDATGEWDYRGNPRESFPYSIATALYRKRVFDRVGLFDTALRFGEDTDWYQRARDAGVAMKKIDVVSLVVRRHGGNMTEGKSLLELNMLKVFKKALDRKRVTGEAGA